MDTLEVLESKINLLKDTIEQLKLSKIEEKQLIEAQIVIIEECQKVLENENLIILYDFSKAIDLISKHNYSIENFSKIISDIKIAIEIKKELNLEDMTLSDNQILTLNKFIDNLSQIKKDLNKKIEEISKENDEEKIIVDLESLRNVLTEKGRRKYVTNEMFESFYEVIDWENLSVDETKSILSAFYNTRNLKSKQNKELVDFEEIISLYKEFLSDKEFSINDNGKYTGLFATLLQTHEMEIRSNIDIENTKEILQFFKDNNILKSFGRNALLKVSLYGKIEYIRSLYEKLKDNKEELETYFEDEASTLWVCEKTEYKKRAFRTSRKNKEKENKTPSLYSQCHSITDEEFRENVKLLNENSDLFADKYDTTNFGAHLKVKTTNPEELKQFKTLLNLATNSSWAIRKNLNLCKLFGLGTVSKIPVSCLELGDIEDKIHLAVELGLLNPPMNEVYLEIEKEVVRNEEFKKTITKKKLYNQSIRNYFQRYTSYLSKMTINEYAYLHYKLQRLGRMGFYNDFFSSNKAGQRSTEFLTDQERKVIANKELIDRFISEKFANEFYSEFIDNYDEYDNIIIEYSQSSKKSQNNLYYDPSILNDELIKKLEENNTIYDIVEQNEKTIEMKNEYVYLFENRIISRYKVLHNASILKSMYGYLDENMLLTSIVRNSFLSLEEFEKIQDYIKERKTQL